MMSCQCVVFGGVIGHQRREDQSSSYFNQEEVNIYLDYIRVMLKGNECHEPVAEK
jgi:hypothetical protein